MFINKLEAALLIEGLSSETKNFYILVKRVLNTPPAELFASVIRVNTPKKRLSPTIEGIFKLNAIVETRAPKGEMREIARGRTHRVVQMRMKTVDRKDYDLYFVIPLKNMTGEEITDQKAKSGIQSRLNTIYNDIKNNVQGASLELEAIYRDKDAALRKLREADDIIMAADRSPESLMASDPEKSILSKLIITYYPDKAKKLISTMATLRDGELRRMVNRFTWAGASVPMFTRTAAGLVAGTGNKSRNDPTVLKKVSELAVAIMVASLLEQMSEAS